MKQRTFSHPSAQRTLLFILLACGTLWTCAVGVAGCGSSRRVSAVTVRAQPAPAPVDTVSVTSRRLSMSIQLPGELQPFEEVRIFSKVSGFVQWIGVDRGSRVKKGELLATLTAPEIVAQKSEAEARVLSAENQRIAGEAKLAADQTTYERLKSASATPGVISDEELNIAQKAAEADKARVVSLRNTTDAARASLRSAREMESYLRITAPFDGVVTRRNVHPGALVGPAGGSGAQASMLRVEEVTHLRLIVSVPEIYVAGVEKGAKVSFTVPAFPGRTFSGTVARMADSIDATTRTMPVEMDVWNPGIELASGMFPSVSWPVRRSAETLFVPQSAVTRTGDLSFVLCARHGKIEQVSVTTGAAVDGMTEVFGSLEAGEEVVLHPSDDLRTGAAVLPHLKSREDGQ
ncbi:MAG TPA: efflux RND transporter periplasmic adaptor subunit [Terracidiphilus sp.]|nr:efflux RND transporter periplasmic adaptor subunit [Terracidiphilus sp.]